MNWTCFSLNALSWTGQHLAFIVEMFVKTNESVTATQQALCLHFNLGKHDPLVNTSLKHDLVMSC